jgi:hypothetical protein
LDGLPDGISGPVIPVNNFRLARVSLSNLVSISSSKQPPRIVQQCSSSSENHAFEQCNHRIPDTQQRAHSRLSCMFHIIAASNPLMNHQGLFECANPMIELNNSKIFHKEESRYR